MTIGKFSNSVPKDLGVQIKGVRLIRVENYKYLGTIFHYNLRWKYINNIVNITKLILLIFYKLDQ